MVVTWHACIVGHGLTFLISEAFNWSLGTVHFTFICVKRIYRDRLIIIGIIKWKMLIIWFIKIVSRVLTFCKCNVWVTCCKTICIKCFIFRSIFLWNIYHLYTLVHVFALTLSYFLHQDISVIRILTVKSSFRSFLFCLWLSGYWVHYSWVPYFLLQVKTCLTLHLAVNLPIFFFAIAINTFGIASLQLFFFLGFGHFAWSLWWIVHCVLSCVVIHRVTLRTQLNRTNSFVRWVLNSSYCCTVLVRTSLVWVVLSDDSGAYLDSIEVIANCLAAGMDWRHAVVFIEIALAGGMFWEFGFTSASFYYLFA